MFTEANSVQLEAPSTTQLPKGNVCVISCGLPTFNALYRYISIEVSNGKLHAKWTIICVLQNGSAHCHESL